MRRVWMALAGLGVLSAGCVATEEGGTLTSIYGRLKADVAYDTAETNSNGNFVQWVSSASVDDDHLAVTSRETRLGFGLKHGGNLTGKVEFDLYGGPAGTPENKPTVLLRHAFVKQKFTGDLSLVVGQTGDVFSPLLPAVLNYGWGWNCGNTGYRRPQARLEFAKAGIVAQAALARPIGGEVSGRGDAQGRVGYELKKDETKIAVGGSFVSGATDDAGADEVFGWALDFDVALGSLVLRGEYFDGRNLKTYLGGIGQGLNNAGAEINTSGIWLQAGYKLTEKLAINAGYMYDDPLQGDLTGTVDVDDRDMNEAWFANVRWKLNRDTEVGLEVSGWTTTYYDGAVTTDYANTRLQTSLIYTF